MALNTATQGWSKLLEPGLRKIFLDNWNEFPPQYSKVFHVLNSKKHTEHDLSLTGFGEWEKRTSEHSSIPYDDPMQGFEVNYTHDEFLKGFKVTRAMVDDEMYNQINKLPANLARSGRAKIETDAAAVLNNGFGNSGYDGEPLFSSNHTLVRAKNSKGDNLIEIASANVSSDADIINEDVVNSALVKARKTTDDAGLKTPIMPNTIIVPPELEDQATRVIQSAQRPGTDFNDVNTVRGKLNIMVMDYLTDSQAWFLMDSNSHEMNFFYRVRPEFKSTDDFDTLEAKYRGYTRYSVGYSNWRGVIGVHVV